MIYYPIVPSSQFPVPVLLFVPSYLVNRSTILCQEEEDQLWRFVKQTFILPVIFNPNQVNQVEKLPQCVVQKNKL